MAVPTRPITPVISAVKSTSMVVTFTDSYNGGFTITTKQIYYSTSPDLPLPWPLPILTDNITRFLINSDGSTTVTNLTPGTVYYFWARTTNSDGTSSWSGRASARTLIGPSPPAQPLLASVTCDSLDVSWMPPSNGGATILGYQVGYGTNSKLPSSIVAASSPQKITGLLPGTVYYIWVRARNSIGWGAWSTPNNARAVAGVYVQHTILTVSGGVVTRAAVWKLAVPYVNVRGVWKPAEAWARNLGVWNKTI